MNILKSCFFGAWIFSLTVKSYAMPGEGVVRDTMGDYIITYWNGASLMQTKFVPATKIDPVLLSRFSASEQQVITYKYELLNKTRAQQPIVRFQFSPVSGIKSKSPVTDIPLAVRDAAGAVEFVKARRSSLSTPTGWKGDITPVASSGFLVEWHYLYKNPDQDNLIEGLLAGAHQNGFGYISQDLPGVIESQIQGDGRHPEYEDEGPDSDSTVVQELERLEANNFVPRNVAVPTIAVPVPFDAAVLLDRIRAHVATWLGKQLLDPAFAAQLDRYMVAAAEAYRLNNTRAGKEHIKKIRELLEHEHKYLDHDEEDNEDTPEHKTATRFTIDRLAARVLDFDLRYVLKRTEHEHEEGERKKER